MLQGRKQGLTSRSQTETPLTMYGQKLEFNFYNTEGEFTNLYRAVP